MRIAKPSNDSTIVVGHTTSIRSLSYRCSQHLTSDRASYQSLVESIRKFPLRLQFAQMIADAGFEVLEMGESGAWTDLWGGITSIHRGSNCERRATNNAIYSFFGSPCFVFGAVLVKYLFSQPHFSSAPRPRYPYHTTMNPAMPPATADLAIIWTYLEEGMDQIMRGEGGPTGSIPSEYL